MRHHNNQDAVALAVGTEPSTAIIVISDGVTSAPNSEVASAVAVHTARDALKNALITQATSPVEALRVATRDAHTTALSAAPASAATLIAAVVRDGLITVGNVGDSRAYWIPDTGPAKLLSKDDSIAQLRIEIGLSREEAEAGIDSHAITRWIGRMSHDVTPSICEHPATEPGWLIVCSDGLWNYASSPEAMRSVVEAFPDAAAGAAVQLAVNLVSWANEQGGRDNITVAATRLPAPDLPAG